MRKVRNKQILATAKAEHEARVAQVEKENAEKAAQHTAEVKRKEKLEAQYKQVRSTVN